VVRRRATTARSLIDVDRGGCAAPVVRADFAVSGGQVRAVVVVVVVVAGHATSRALNTYIKHSTAAAATVTATTTIDYGKQHVSSTTTRQTNTTTADCRARGGQTTTAAATTSAAVVGPANYVLRFGRGDKRDGTVGVSAGRRGTIGRPFVDYFVIYLHRLLWRRRQSVDGVYAHTAVRRARVVLWC